MNKRENKDLMMNKEEIMLAVEESQEVKKNYPNFWKFYQMLLILNDSVFDLEKLNNKRDKK